MTAGPVLAAATAALIGLAAVPQGQEVFRAGTDTVLLSVTASDGRTHPVSGLDEGDFRVLEDGVPQAISLFARDPQPIALSILIDSSTSMEDKLRVAEDAAIGFCRRLGPNDEAQVVTFNSEIRIRQPFTHDVAALEKAIRTTRASGSTSLYTAIYVALNELNRVRRQSPEAVRRQAMIVLSDGEDTTSLLGYEEVLDLSKRSTVAVYAIGLRDRSSSASAHGFNEADFVLRTLSQTTGGRVFFVQDPAELPGIYGQIADELANQYILGYVSTNTSRDGAWRRVAVQIKRPGVIARTKAGYFGPKKGR